MQYLHAGVLSLWTDLLHYTVSLNYRGAKIIHICSSNWLVYNFDAKICIMFVFYLNIFIQFYCILVLYCIFRLHLQLQLTFTSQICSQTIWPANKRDPQLQIKLLTVFEVGKISSTLITFDVWCKCFVSNLILLIYVAIYILKCAQCVL